MLAAATEVDLGALGLGSPSWASAGAANIKIEAQKAADKVFIFHPLVERKKSATLILMSRLSIGADKPDQHWQCH